MNTYYCLLGNTPLFSIAELKAVLPLVRIEMLNDAVAQIDLASDTEATDLLDTLGGTIKIIRHIEHFETKPDDEDILLSSSKILTREKTKNKISFGFSEMGRDHLPVFNARSLKKHLQSLGYSAQFKDGPRTGLPAALLLHKPHIQEIVLIGSNKGTILGKTIAVQNIDAWTNVDRNKPYADRKKGMLPPKVARMMVNLALAHTDEPQPAIYDPFCGSGTILLEAIALGKNNLIGSDLDLEAVRGTKENVAWYAEQFETTLTPEIKGGDVTKVNPSQKIDLLITEPFLGKPKPNPAKVPFILKGLEKLYRGAFRHWSKILKDGATVVIVIPSIVVQDKKGKTRIYTLEKLIDSLASLGYTTSSEPIEYFREQAIVRRNIYTFTYNTENKA